MNALFRSLILSLLASLSMAAHASCESDVTAQFISIAGTRFSEKPGVIRFYDRQNTLRDFSYGVVVPNAQGTQIEKWAAERLTQGTQLGIIRLSDLESGARPRFAGGFLPAKNLLLMLESSLGIDVPAYKHEVRHADFDQQLRKGQCTPFAAHGYETFEELYTTAMHLLDVPSKYRAYVIGRFLDDVLHVYEALPVEELEHYRSITGKIRSGEIEMLKRPGLRMELPNPGLAEDLDSQRFEAKNGTKSPFYLSVHNTRIHGRRFLAVQLRQTGLMPVTIYIANPGGPEAYMQLQGELMRTDFAGPLARKLLNLVWDRLSELASMTKATIESFDLIKNELAQGRSGEEQAKALAQMLEPDRQKIVPPFSVE